MTLQQLVGWSVFVGIVLSLVILAIQSIRIYGLFRRCFQDLKNLTCITGEHSKIANDRTLRNEEKIDDIRKTIGSGLSQVKDNNSV